LPSHSQENSQFFLPENSRSYEGLQAELAGSVVEV